MPSITQMKQSLEKFVDFEGRLATKAFDAVDQAPQVKKAINAVGETVVDKGGRQVDAFLDSMSPETRSKISDAAESVVRFEWKVLSSMFRGAASVIGAIASGDDKK